MAEEGSKHFANVYENGFWEGLFYVEMEVGYFNFIANFLTAISSLIAIEFSPIIVDNKYSSNHMKHMQSGHCEVNA